MLGQVVPFGLVFRTVSSGPNVWMAPESSDLFDCRGCEGRFSDPVEGAEDDVDDAVVQVEQQCLTASDVIIGIYDLGEYAIHLSSSLRQPKCKGPLFIGVSSNQPVNWLPSPSMVWSLKRC